MKKSESGLFSSAGTLSRPGYFEVDIDVGSTALATNATHLAGGYAKNLVLDLGFALQVVTACLMASGGSVMSYVICFCRNICYEKIFASQSCFCAESCGCRARQRMSYRRK